MTGALREIQAVRQIPGERLRRWFTSEEFDLYIWLGKTGEPEKFQLCYNKSLNEKALTWSPSGVSHENVDSGESGGQRHKEAALLVPDGFFNAQRVLTAFQQAATDLPPELTDFVVQRLKHHAATKDEP